jgi:hypothetical protein
MADKPNEQVVCNVKRCTNARRFPDFCRHRKNNI